jgi:SAM-dependent methyltransferase
MTDVQSLMKGVVRLLLLCVGGLLYARPDVWMVGYAKRTAYRIRVHGFARTAIEIATGVRNAMAWLAEQWFDSICGIDTAGRVLLYNADGRPETNPLYLDYQPTPVRTMRALLRQLDAHVGSSTFVDFGSGKGRVLLIASEFRFTRIIGVEFDEKLHRTACKNIGAFRGRRQCHDVSSVVGRAEEFAVPSGDLVLYFFHPFEAGIMERILDNVVRSYRENPRRILLLLFRPSHADLVERLAEFRRLPVKPLPYDVVRLSSDYRDVTGAPYDAAVFVAG